MGVFYIVLLKILVQRDENSKGYKVVFLILFIVLFNLQERFLNSQYIYTYCGEFYLCFFVCFIVKF